MRIAFLALVAITACGGTTSPAGERSGPDPRGEPADGAGKQAVPSAPNHEPARPTPEPASPKPEPAAPKPAPVAPKTPACPAKQNPAGCPDAEPNINARCKKNGLACTYGASCCPPVYVCNKLRFEARFQSCP